MLFNSSSISLPPNHHPVILAVFFSTNLWARISTGERMAATEALRHTCRDATHFRGTPRRRASILSIATYKPAKRTVPVPDPPRKRRAARSPALASIDGTASELHSVAVAIGDALPMITGTWRSALMPTPYDE
jgi:hypothetical protein